MARNAAIAAAIVHRQGQIGPIWPVQIAITYGPPTYTSACRGKLGFFLQFEHGYYLMSVCCKKKIT